MKALEIVKWKSRPNVTDEQMIEAVENMLPDLKSTEGFLSQSLHKDKNGNWVDVYYWNSPENAKLSNDRMAEKESLKRLLELIDLDSVSMEIFEIFQGSN